MTCQWCRHFRYKGVSVCARPGGDGNTLPAKGRTSECQWFDPRRTCTTCEYRCSTEERSSLRSDSDVCPKWTLRSISKWGGSRKNPAKCQDARSDDLDSGGQVAPGENEQNPKQGE